MKPKLTLIVALFLALLAGALTPISASAHEHHRRLHVYFYYGSQPSYYYQPSPVHYSYWPEGGYYRSDFRLRHHRRESREVWRHHHRDKDWDRR